MGYTTVHESPIRTFNREKYHIWDYIPRKKSEANRKAETFREKKKSNKARVVKGKGGWYIYVR